MCSKGSIIFSKRSNPRRGERPAKWWRKAENFCCFIFTKQSTTHSLQRSKSNKHNVFKIAMLILLINRFSANIIKKKLSNNIEQEGRRKKSSGCFLEFLTDFLQMTLSSNNPRDKSQTSEVVLSVTIYAVQATARIIIRECFDSSVYTEQEWWVIIISC